MSDQFKAWGTQPVPYSQEAEAALLGAVIMAPDAFVITTAFLNAEDFFLLRHRYIWQALEKLSAQSRAIDYLTVCTELKAAGHLDEIGGPAYITQLVNAAPLTYHAETYGRIVADAAYRRRLMATADQLRALALDEAKPAEAVRGEAERKLLEVNTLKDDGEDETFGQLVSAYYDKVERLMRGDQTMTGLPTGFRDFDNLLLGLQKTDLILAAGRPGMGKSSWLLSIALAAAKAGKRVGWFSLEMPKEQLVQRAASHESGINLQRLRSGNLAAEDWRRFVQVMGQIHQLPIHIDDRGGLTPFQLRSRCYQWMAKYGPLDLIVVDYLQLMSGGKAFMGKDNRVNEIGFISTHLKGFAREFDTPILAASQLNRALEARQDKRPILSDLRDSGNLEQDADVVAFIYRDEVYNEATEFPNQAEIIVAKHRNGPIGTVTLYFEKTLTKFMNCAERSLDLARVNGVAS
ncbi:MAG TPA: replicative DNA helicase [Phototrophicaceae bacterium]|nr:replicative DNA helicase [Phototrophicaceae bacterium]